MRLARLSRRFASLQLPLAPFPVHKLDAKALPTAAETSREEVLQYLKDMVTIRRIETTSDNYYKNKDIRGFCHLCDGQEAVAVGMEGALTKEDCLITAYRVHGQAYMRGESPRAIFAEMFGRVTGSSKGKGGSMHFYNKETNFYGGNGIVGAQIPVGAGLAFALKYENKPNVAVIMYGDGAANQGQVAEASNMAALWHLPAIFVCENNLYGMGTSNKRAAANTLYYTRGDTIPGFLIQGQDIFQVREGMKFAKKWALEHGPIFVEINTYRYHGHSMSDPGTTYRSREEVEGIRSQKDPIELLKSFAFTHKLATEEEVKEMEKSVRKAVEEVAKQAHEDPWPAAQELLTDVYDPSVKSKHYLDEMRDVEVTHKVVV